MQPLFLSNSHTYSAKEMREKENLGARVRCFGTDPLLVLQPLFLFLSHLFSKGNERNERKIKHWCMGKML